jgi:2-phospho-L-lactate/phosphoenolpyruvate guanylyltransferase
MTLWAVVPLKPLAVAKGRLAAWLSPDERTTLARVLLGDVLAALRAAPAVSRVLLISPDPAVLALAGTQGATPLLELAEVVRGAERADAGANGASPPVQRASAAIAADDGEVGLNAALDHAAAVAVQGGADALLVLPADVPLVTRADIAALAAELPPPPSLVLAPTADGGTGALLRCPPLAVPASFGTASVAAHLGAAARRGVTARVLWRWNLSLDLDRPEDAQRLIALPVRSATQRLLLDWDRANARDAAARRR